MILRRMMVPTSTIRKAVCLMVVVLLIGLKSFTQQKVDQLIPNEDKRKVEHARKLFNKYKVYEGEMILKDLIKLHPENPYYHEALVQLQQQVLDRIKDAGVLLEELNPQHLAIDSTDDDSSDVAMSARRDSLKLKSNEQLLEWNGLDRSSKDTAKMSKKEKRKIKRELEEALETPLQDAVVTIDSSLVSHPIDEEEESGNADVFVKRDRDDHERKKQLKLLTDLAQIPYDSYKQNLILNARNATRMSQSCDSASHSLRMMMVDTLNPDINAGELALEAYTSGLDEYATNNTVLAAKFFEKAIELYPLFYMAHLKLGDCYYLMSKDTAAVRKYQQASFIEINRPEAFAKLAMVHYNRGKYVDAATAILDALMIYPEHQYMSLLKRIMLKSGKEMNTQWIMREVYPLTTSHVYEEIIAKEKTPWWHYQAAKGDVYSYFDTVGIVRPNDKTSERYLEVYGWKQMLNKSGLDKFPFARVMDDMGYLDCYVLITLFHQDVYGQFADLMKREPEKVRKYWYLILNWDDKKFDPLREKMKSREKKVTSEKKEVKKEEKK